MNSGIRYFHKIFYFFLQSSITFVCPPIILFKGFFLDSLWGSFNRLKIKKYSIRVVLLFPRNLNLRTRLFVGNRRRNAFGFFVCFSSFDRIVFFFSVFFKLRGNNREVIRNVGAGTPSEIIKIRRTCV